MSRKVRIFAEQLGEIKKSNENMILQNYIDKAKEDFKELKGKSHGFEYDFIYRLYYCKITNDRVLCMSENGTKANGFDLNYKSIAATIIDDDGYAVLLGDNVEVYREDGRLLGVINIDENGEVITKVKNDVKDCKSDEE